MRIASDIDLETPCCAPGKPDLVLKIRTGGRPITPEPSVQWGSSSGIARNWAVLPGLARIEACESGRVGIEAAAELDSAALRTLVISTALPLALQLRSGLLLEASAIRWQGLGILLVGRGYCGKSSLAALMADSGAELLADSHCFVRLDAEGDLVLAPAVPHIRLWPAQARLLQGRWPAPKVLRSGCQKCLFVVPERFASTSSPIHGVVVLRRGVDESFREGRLDVVKSLQALAWASDRLRPALTSSQSALRFRIMSKLASLGFCNLLQWPRWGANEWETRSRLVDLLATRAQEAAT